MRYPRNPDRLEIYSETTQSKIFVGTLSVNRDADTYTFEYDRKYLDSRSVIPIGPELPLRRRMHVSKKGELFPSFNDRIPSRNNPAYEEYCRQKGISPKEKNVIILLGTIGHRGPSTFVFESLYITESLSNSIRSFRESLDLSVRELAIAFDINYPTLSRIETGKSKDKNTMALIEIYLNFPEVAMWVIRKNERKLRQPVANRLMTHFQAKPSSRQ